VKYSEVEEKKELEIFNDIILPNLEQMFEGGKPYICGYEYCLADIAYYNEIANTLIILEAVVDEIKFPNISRWMKRMEDIG
jgi:glutathione S-transferase